MVSWKRCPASAFRIVLHIPRGDHRGDSRDDSGVPNLGQSTNWKIIFEHVMGIYICTLENGVSQLGSRASFE